jgi:uncharacterized membrane protein
VSDGSERLRCIGEREGIVQAFLSVPHSETQTAAMVDHRNWAIATAIIWWIAALWAAWSARRNQSVHYALTGLLVVSMIPLLVTGWKGAELVYRHGVGVIAERTDAVVTTGQATQHPTIAELGP